MHTGSASALHKQNTGHIFKEVKEAELKEINTFLYRFQNSTEENP